MMFVNRLLCKERTIQQLHKVAPLRLQIHLAAFLPKVSSCREGSSPIISVLQTLRLHSVHRIHTRNTMAAIDKTAISDLLSKGPDRSLVGGKQLTLAFAGLYIASTTLATKPLLVWEPGSYYMRYYIPKDALHRDIQAALSSESKETNGQSNGKASANVKVEVLDKIEGKGSDSKALIEQLTIGSKSTTWARIQGGQLDGLIRFEPKEMDNWFENGALFAGIKNPYKRIDTKPVARHIEVKVNGEVVAESEVAVLLNETGLKDAYYLPATSLINPGSIEKSDWRTACPYKGEAWLVDFTFPADHTPTNMNITGTSI